MLLVGLMTSSKTATLIREEFVVWGKKSVFTDLARKLEHHSKESDYGFARHISVSVVSNGHPMDAGYPTFDEILEKGAGVLNILPCHTIEIRELPWTTDQLGKFLDLLDVSKKCPAWNIDCRSLHLIPFIHERHGELGVPVTTIKYLTQDDEWNLRHFKLSLADSKKLVGYRSYLSNIWQLPDPVWVMWSHLTYWNVKLYKIMLGFMNPLRVQRRLPTALMRRLFETLCIREELTVCGTKWLTWQSDWDEPLTTLKAEVEAALHALFANH